MGNIKIIKDAVKKLWTNPSLFMPFVLQPIAFGICAALSILVYLICYNLNLNEDPSNIISIALASVIFIATSIFLYATFIGTVNSNEKGLKFFYGKQFFSRMLLFLIFLLIYAAIAAIISLLIVTLLLKASSPYGIVDLSYDSIPAILAIFLALMMFPLLTPYYLVIEDLTIFKAIKKSFVISFKYYFDILALLLVAGMLCLIFLFVLAIPFAIIAMAASSSQTAVIVIASIFGVIAGIFTGPYLNLCLYLFAKQEQASM